MGDKPKATIYTDGSALVGPYRCGGWAAIVTVGDRTIMAYGGRPNTTNNRMELAAAINGLMLLKKASYDVTLYSDSRYLINAFEQDWISSWKRHNWVRSNGEMVANVDLWERLCDLATKHTVKWKWVKGHDESHKHPLNEIADKLAGDQTNRYADHKGDEMTTITEEDGTVIMRRKDWMCEYDAALKKQKVYGVEIEGSLSEQQTMFDPDSGCEDTCSYPADAYEEESVPMKEESSQQDEDAAEPASQAEADREQPGYQDTMAHLDLHSLQLLMEMESVKETSLLHPCGQYDWCPMCKGSDTDLPCINAFLAYREISM